MKAITQNYSISKRCLIQQYKTYKKFTDAIGELNANKKRSHHNRKKKN